MKEIILSELVNTVDLEKGLQGSMKNLEIKGQQGEFINQVGEPSITTTKTDTEIILEFNRNNYNFVIESINKIIKNIISEV